MSFNLNFGAIAGSLRGLWEELVERRLWPLAIALVVALIALPVVVSKPAAKSPSPLPTPAPAGGAASPLAAFQPAVSTEGRKSSEIRKDLRRFKQKNPFTPQGLGAGASASSSSAGDATPTILGATGTTTPTSADTGTSTAGGTSTGSSPLPTSTESPTASGEVKYYTYTVDVRFGKTGSPDSKTLTQFRALPSSDDPVVVFMGVRPDGETAAFLVSANATTTGDAKCMPSDDECTFLYMKKGDKQTIESVGQDGAVVDYELELRDINVKVTDGPAKASSSASTAASRSRARAKARRASLTRAVRSFERLGF